VHVNKAQRENQLKLRAVENRRATTVSVVAVNQEPHHEGDRIDRGVWSGVLKFNKYCSTFVLFDKKFLILN
jgi:hypothetical protein